MSKKIIMSAALAAAFKRNDRKAILAETLVAFGFPDEAADVAAQSRVTNALIDRTCITLHNEPEEAPAKEEKAEKKDAAKLDYEDKPKKKGKVTVGDIKALCEDGSKKSLKAAKKALKEQFDEDHPNYKELKKLIKKAGK